MLLNLNVYISFSLCPPLHIYSHLHVGCPDSFSLAIRDIWMNKVWHLSGLCWQVLRIWGDSQCQKLFGFWAPTTPEEPGGLLFLRAPPGRSCQPCGLTLTYHPSYDPIYHHFSSHQAHKQPTVLCTLELRPRDHREGQNTHRHVDKGLPRLLLMPALASETKSPGEKGYGC